MHDADRLERDKGSPGDFLLLAILFFIATWAFLATRGRWLDPIIDIGRDLYTASALVPGGSLYESIHYNYPPLAPWLLAATVRLFGNSLATFVAFSVSVAIAATIALYGMGKLLAGRGAGLAAALLFVSINWVGTVGSNFVLPYSFAATLGVTLLLLYLFALIRFVHVTRRHATFALALTLGLLASWCKLEYALVVAVTLPVMMLIHRLPLRFLSLTLGAALSSILLVCLTFGNPVRGLSLLASNLVPTSFLHGATGTSFYSRVSGADRFATHAVLIVTGAALVLLSVTLLGALDRLSWRSHSAISRALMVVLIASAFLGSAVLLATDHRFFRSWSLLQLICLGWALTRDRKSPLLLLSLASLLCTLKIYWKITPTWYGTALILPTYILAVYVLFRYLPSRNVYRRQTALLWLPLIAGLSLQGLTEQLSLYELQRFPVRTAKGTFLDSNRGRAQVLEDFLRYAPGRIASLVVVPEGVTLNYLLDVPVPLRRQIFTPIETADPRVEQEVLANFRENPPSHVAFVSRDVSEYGYRQFGLDYDQNLFSHIREHYAVEREWKTEGFSLVLLRRK